MKIWRIIYDLNATVGIHLWPVRRRGRNQPVALNKLNHAHFWPHWMLESSKHAPAWQASEESWSPPALPVCLAGCMPRGQDTGMDGPVAGSLLPRWLALSAGSPPGGVAPWRQAMIGYANFHLLPPNTCGLCGERKGWWNWSLAECACSGTNMLSRANLSWTLAMWEYSLDIDVYRSFWLI